jgi:hypothetical protein
MEPLIISYISGIGAKEPLKEIFKKAETEKVTANNFPELLNM